jgi:hypothetical protein
MHLDTGAQHAAPYKERQRQAVLVRASAPWQGDLKSTHEN